MLTLKNERELNTLGLKIHPGDPTKAIPLNEPTDSVPDKSWSLAHLGHFASVGLAEANRLDAEAVCLARKSTVQTFWAGCALTLAKPKVKGAGEKWTEWLKQRNIPRTNAWEAMQLYQRAQKVEAVAKLTLTEAKQQFAITKPPKRERGNESGTDCHTRNDAHAAATPIPDDAVRLYHCRFQDLDRNAGIAPASVNLICTDIPYGKEFLDQLPELAAFAQRVLVEGGLLVVYTGQYYLPQYLTAFGEHLTYRWTLASVWNGDGTVIHPLGIIAKWKPILVYSKGPWQKRGRYSDVLHVESKEKTHHPWQQPLEEVERLISYFSHPGDLVVDPCGGSFTTAVACRNLGRRFTGCDVDPDCMRMGRERLAELTAKTAYRVAKDIGTLPAVCGWSRWLTRSISRSFALDPRTRSKAFGHGQEESQSA